MVNRKLLDTCLVLSSFPVSNFIYETSKADLPRGDLAFRLSQKTEGLQMPV